METEAAAQGQPNSVAAMLTEAFVYTPLPNASDYIRLLRPLEPIPEVVLAIFEMTTHSIHDLPQYHAISYMWGSDDVRHTIVVNGRCVEVNANARYALSQACSPAFYNHDGSFSHLWMDAICINQLHLGEKSLQVQMMADIYRLAEQVFACIGPSDDDSKLLSELFETDAIAEAKRYRYIVREPANHCSSNSGSSERLAYPIAAEWLFSQDEEYLESICGAMADVAHLPYWSRMWIVQELCMGMNCVVVYGDYFFMVDDLLFLERVIDHMLDMELTVSCRFVVEAAWGYMSKGFMLRALSPRSDTHEKLVRRLAELKDFKCRDPRDRLYALNGVVYWGEERQRLVPDYTKGTFDLLVQAVSHVNPSMALDGPFTESPSEMVTYNVLEALQIEASHEQMLRGVINRQRGSAVSDSFAGQKSLRYEYAYAFGHVTEGPSGALTIPFQQVTDDQSQEATDLLRMLGEIEKSASTGASDAVFHGRVPRRLLAGAAVAGLVCQGAQDGDYLFPFDAGQSVAEAVGQLYVVLRSQSCPIFEIVGQAIIFAHYEPKIQYPTWEEFQDQESFVYPPGPIFELTVTAEDLVVLAGQDYLLRSQDHTVGAPGADHYRVPRTFDMQARLQRLVTAVTTSRNCHARMLAKASQAQAYRAVMSACSFGHMTRNARQLERTAFSQKHTNTGFVFMQESVPIRHFAGPFHHAPGDPCPTHGSKDCAPTAPSDYLTEPRITWRQKEVECTCYKPG